MDINLFIMAAWEKRIDRCTIWRSANRKAISSKRFSIYAARKGTDAANELWEVREKYKSLITDFESLDVTEVRSRRDSLIMAVSKINKEYPGTDEKSFSNAQTDICKYEFSEGEAAKIFHTEDAMKNK